MCKAFPGWKRWGAPPSGPAGHSPGTQIPVYLFNFTLGTKRSQLKYKQKSRELDLFNEIKILSMWKILIYVQTIGGLIIDKTDL